MEKISSQDYVRNFVKDHDYNLYILHFFAPRSSRRVILALMGLHIEIRMIPQKVHDPMMRLIRLQWWKDEIASDSPSPKSPILNELSLYNDKLSLAPYFDRADQFLRGNTVDIDEALYTAMDSVIDDPREKASFSKKLIHHDILADQKYFRALRMWLGI